MNIRLPRPPRTDTQFGQWATDLVTALERAIPQSSIDELIDRTTRGTFIRPKPGKGGGSSAVLQFKDQWNKLANYAKSDLVICDTNDEQDDGTQAGLYLANESIQGDDTNQEPSVDTTRWKLVARGNWPKLTFRIGKKKVVVDAGRDKDAQGKDTLPSIKIFADSDNAAAGSVKIDLGDIPVDAGDKEIKIRLTQGKDTDTGSCRYCLALRSEWFD